MGTAALTTIKSYLPPQALELDMGLLSSAPVIEPGQI